MRIDVLTVLPEFHESPLRTSILGRAAESGIAKIRVHDIRDWTTDRHRVADDAPYGGGGGMVMKAEPVVRAAEAVRAMVAEDPGVEAAARVPLIHLSPQGERFDARLAAELAALPGMILLCGCYEGIDERAIERVVDREISIGDYVLPNGDLAALVVVGAVVRRLPGALGCADSAANDSFEDGLLDFPHYTRPEVFEGAAVPEILLGGHHAKIAEWRRREAMKRTATRRPDLLEKARLTPKERAWIEGWMREAAEMEAGKKMEFTTEAQRARRKSEEERGS